MEGGLLRPCDTHAVRVQVKALGVENQSQVSCEPVPGRESPFAAGYSLE
jgi:hypothetical protein